MRIAVIGSGISGLVAARALDPEHQVVIFEARAVPGGHTHTVTVMEGRRPIPIDTGFIVFNTRTYPGLTRLLGELGVAWCDSEMSFSVRSERRDFEYNGHTLNTLFAQRRNLASPRFLRMVRDILRFYREGHEILDQAEERPILSWLADRGYSEAFIEDHLTPMMRAVWSLDRMTARQFPGRFLVRFFENHGFLSLRDQPQWLTIPGGAKTYVEAILARFRGELRLSSPVDQLARDGARVWVKPRGGAPESFDHVILAAHSDHALKMVKDPTPLERELLGAIPYQRNEAVLHTDRRVMPRTRRAWASWNVHLDDEGSSGACLTYWMNRLQPLRAEEDYFVTLNHSDRIDPAKVIRRETYHHPVFSTESVRAQARHRELIGLGNISYCGAYWANGFHEDGLQSALRVVEHVRANPTSQRGVAA